MKISNKKNFFSSYYKIFNNYNFANISIFSYFIIFSIIITIFTITIYFYFSQKIHSQSISSVLEKQSLRIEKSLVDSIEYSAYLMNYLGNQIKDHNHRNLHYIERLLSSFRLNSDVNNKIPWNMFSWANEETNLLVNSDLGIVKPINLSSRDYIPLTISEPGKIHLGKPAFGKVSGEWIMPSGMGIVDNKNRYIGSVIFGFKISKLAEKLWQSTTSDDVSFAVFDQDGDLIINSTNFSINNKLSEYIKSIATSPRKNGEIAKFSVFGSNENYGFFQKIDKYPYIIITKLDSNLAKKNLFYKLYPYLLEALMILFSLLSILFLLKSIVVNPILSLSNNAKSLSFGKLNVDIHKSNVKEINHLSKSISMVKDFFQKEQKSKIELDLARKEAEKANLSKTNLLRSISHDLKNYICNILNLTKTILDKENNSILLKNNEDLETLKIISSQSEELMYFVEDLLDTNQTEKGEFSLGKLEKCNIAELITRIVLLNKGFAIRHKISLKTNIEDNLPEVKCDIRRIKQILTNLITNAIKYSNHDSSVNIFAKYLKEQDQVYIEIADQGIGMTKEEIEMAISGSGQNIDKSNLNKPIDSHGIGMTIVKKLVELHKGKMEIDSIKGKGTKVKIYFNAEEKVSDNQLVSNSLVAKNQSILLAEDNPVSSMITSKILLDHGYRVEPVKNGKEAIEALEKEDYDLVLMDGEMPILDGYEATKTIRLGNCFKRFKNYRNIPIIALMANSEIECIEKAKISGMNSHLDKSSSKKEILQMIDRYTQLDSKH